MALAYTETLYASADGPIVRVSDRMFLLPRALRVVMAPTYGRVLFAPLVELTGCRFAISESDPAVLIEGVR